MRAVLQNLKTGRTFLEDVPTPALGKQSIIVSTALTLISTGTEKMLVDFGRSNLIGKIKKQPDKVKMVLSKVKTDGLLSTYEAVQSKLDQPIALGYCNVGRILEIGERVDGFTIGDRVVSNGAHADVVRVASTLCCKIPDSVSDEEASFTIVGAIALQGLRIANPTLGETFVVMGLGLIGLLTVQLLRANGCRVIGLDFDEAKLAFAKKFGAETVNLSTHSDPLAFVDKLTHGKGVDGVILTLSTASHDPVHTAAQMCRKRGRIILVGVTGLNLQRADFYEKELSFQVSCSYGPGRYDPAYEEKGQDYPVGFVRWTAQRNMEAFLGLLNDKQISVAELISHRFDIEKAEDAYELLHTGQPSLGILLEFNKDQVSPIPAKRTISYPSSATPVDKVCVGFIGAGNYALRTLLPALKKTPATLKAVCSSGGVTASYAARKYGVHQATTDIKALLKDPELNTLFVATRHGSHASLVCEALEAGKNVFVEKPLALSQKDLDKIETLYGKLKKSPLLMVGFNRRFSPFVVKMKELLDTTSGPKAFVMTVNPGNIPGTHWTQDRGEGGGRIMGEACHFIDLLYFLAQSDIIAATFTGFKQPAVGSSDCSSIALTFADGSIGTIHYLANGHRSFSKERLEVFVEGKILCLDNFRTLKGWGWKGFSKMWRFSQDKGQNQCVAAFYQAIASGTASPISFEDLLEVARVTIAMGEDAWACDR